MGFSVRRWLFYVGQLLICVGRSSRPSGGYFALSAYQYAPGVSIRSFGTLVAHQYAHSIRSFSVSIRSQRINTLTFSASIRSQPAYQYAHSASIRSFSALATLASWFGYQCSCDAGVAAALTASPDAHILSVYRRSQRLQTPTTQRLQTLTASADAHSVSKRPQRINAPTAYDTHIFHSVSTRPQRINTPTAHGTHCAHSVSIRPQRYGDASVAATLQGIQGIKGGAPDFEFIPCLTFVGDAVSPLYD